jgi:hypothetical protein
MSNGKEIVIQTHAGKLKDELGGWSGIIEGRAHALVDGSTFPFLNGVAHFLPNAKLEDTLTKLTSMLGKGRRRKPRPRFAMKWRRLSEIASRRCHSRQAAAHRRQIRHKILAYKDLRNRPRSAVGAIYW